MFEIGSIVGLKSHPFCIKFSPENLVIGGDAQGIPPLMVVVETLSEFNITIDNFAITQCKCNWYSHKSHMFESEWFWVHQLYEHLPQGTINNTQDNYPKIGSLIRFKTTDLELGKKKSSIDFGSNSTSNRRSINSLLYFVAPVLQVTGIIAGNNKHAINEKSKKKRRESNHQLKCKYFVSSDSKFIETILPLEAVEVIQPVEESKIECITGAIKANKWVKIKSARVDIHDALVRPRLINYRSGQYYLEAFDYLTGENIEYLLNGNPDSFMEIECIVTKLPRFTPSSNGLFSVSKIDRQNILELDNKNYWRIKYQDNNGDITERTIHSPEIIDVVESKTNSDNSTPLIYVKAHCMLRKGVRHFKLDGIKELIVLNISYHPKDTPDILIDQKGEIAQEAKGTPLS